MKKTIEYTEEIQETSDGSPIRVAVPYLVTSNGEVVERRALTTATGVKATPATPTRRGHQRRIDRESDERMERERSGNKKLRQRRKKKKKEEEAND